MDLDNFLMRLASKLPHTKLYRNNYCTLKPKLGGEIQSHCEKTFLWDYMGHDFLFCPIFFAKKFQNNLKMV